MIPPSTGVCVWSSNCWCSSVRDIIEYIIASYTQQIKAVICYVFAIVVLFGS